MLVLGSLTTCIAQVLEPDSSAADLENLSRSEIRRLLLDMDPTTEVYKYAANSRKYTGSSIALYQIGGLCFLTGIGFLTGVANPPDGSNGNAVNAGVGFFSRFMAISVFSVGTVMIIKGTERTRWAQGDLKHAVQLYKGERWASFF